MPIDFKVECLEKLKKMNRLVYILMIIISVISAGAGLTRSFFVIGYYIIVSNVLLLCDEYLIYKNTNMIKDQASFPAILLSLRTIIYIFLLVFASIFEKLPPVIYSSVFIIIIFLILQELFLRDVFDSFINEIRIAIVMGLTCFVFLALQFRKDVNGVWFLVFFASGFLISAIVIFLYRLLAYTIKYLDDRYTKVFFENSDIKEENNKLIEFREKVEKVNSEINYQKLNLTKAYDSLEETNKETRSLIEVMKYFTSSFDVEKNARIMMNNVMDIKKAGTVGFFINADIYMNDQAFVDVVSENSLVETLLLRDIYNIYKMVLNRKNTDPVVLVDNYDFKYPFMSGGNICNAVAFPAYENEVVYGVMIVISSKYDFFDKGFSFYESSIMDFTSALISDRLYLKAEEMAKKDGLSKVYNRQYFNQFYPSLINEVEGLGDDLTVAMMDIDHFKSVNDTYGHLAGDEVIKMVANVYKKYAERYDATAVRYGGEEFLLIFRNIRIDEAYSILKQVQTEISSTVVRFEDYEINVNVSIGVASYRETCEDIDEVIDRADQAMYFSKENGRGMIVIDGRERESLTQNQIDNPSAVQTVDELQDKYTIKNKEQKKMKILVINAGSSSLKYQLIDSETEGVLAKGLCERIGIEGGKIKYDSSQTGEKKEKDIDLPDHGVALKAVIDILIDPEDGAIKSLDEIDAVGHRVVHGGEYFNSSVKVDDDVIAKIDECCDLAPLHNPANLLGIRACQKIMPGVPQCVTFDTAFHQTMPEKAYIYGIPYSYYENYKIRRYGFHGTSHRFVSGRAAELLGKPVEDSKIIVCHLGGGASITAVQGGKSVDTSMGLTPLEGLIMGTRSGNIDPAIIQYIVNKENKSVDEVLNILNKQSGLFGLSGRSSDCRDIDAGIKEGDKRSIIAFNSFVYSAVKIIGSYIAAMNGVDMIAFTAGIGENDDKIRAAILESFGYMGVEIDAEKNSSVHGDEAEISTPDSKVKVFVIPTNEELAIARETAALL